jgi:hypothetical protein
MFCQAPASAPTSAAPVISGPNLSCDPVLRPSDMVMIGTVAARLLAGIIPSG